LTAVVEIGEGCGRERDLWRMKGSVFSGLFLENKIKMRVH